MKKLNDVLTNNETLLYFAGVVVGTIVMAMLVNKYIQHVLHRKTKDSDVDITNFVFLKHLIVLTIYMVGLGWALFILPFTRNFAKTLLAGAGATTLIIGFASQQILSNMMSGIFIIINKPYRINDRISVQNNEGTVVEINWHDTVIEDDKKDHIIIPNSLISNSVVKNLTPKSDQDI